MRFRKQRKKMAKLPKVSERVSAYVHIKRALKATYKERISSFGREKKMILLFLKFVTVIEPKQDPKEIIWFILSNLKIQPYFFFFF